MLKIKWLREQFTLEPLDRCMLVYIDRQRKYHAIHLNDEYDALEMMIKDLLNPGGRLALKMLGGAIIIADGTIFREGYPIYAFRPQTKGEGCIQVKREVNDND